MGAPACPDVCLSDSAAHHRMEHTPQKCQHSLRRRPQLCVACLIWLGFIEGAPLLRSMSDLFVCASASSSSSLAFVHSVDLLYIVATTVLYLEILLTLTSALNHHYAAGRIQFVSGSVLVAVLVSFVQHVSCRGDWKFDFRESET